MRTLAILAIILCGQAYACPLSLKSYPSACWRYDSSHSWEEEMEDNDREMSENSKARVQELNVEDAARTQQLINESEMDSFRYRERGY